MQRVIVHIEGGGDSKNSQQPLRLGFKELIGEYSARTRQSLRPRIACWGGRDRTFKKFKGACTDNPETIHLLLVDSEGPVNTSPIQHLITRDRWDFTGIDHDMIHLMVQTMEAWFMADKEAIKNYYGNRLNERALPNRRNVEDIPKDDLKPSLARSGSATRKGGYREIRDGSGILYYLDREKVKTTLHGKRFFEKLEEIFSTM